MYQDNLERFVHENREAFDDRTPSQDVWAGIEASIGQNQARRIALWPVLRAVAAGLALLLTGAGIGSYFTLTQQNSVAEISPEYTEMEQYYQQEISNKYRQLAAYDKEEMVKTDLQQLDQVMQELKDELAVAPRGKEEQIVENLIIGYQTKIQILERVLDRIQTNNQNKEDDETSI